MFGNFSFLVSIDKNYYEGIFKNIFMRFLMGREDKNIYFFSCI